MADKKKANTKLSGREPVFIVKPAFRNFGLDYLHIALIVLVVILVALAFALSTFKQGTVITNCQYGNVNGTCNTTVHNNTQVLAAAERILAGYSNFNTSLSLVPYYSLINQSKTDYLSDQKEWLVTVPYIDPLAKDTVFNVSMLLYDSNLSLAGSYIQSVRPQITTNNTVVGLGTVNLYGESACKTTAPVPVYVVVDPYSPDVLGTFDYAINASRHFSNKVNVSYFLIFSGYSQQYYAGYGEAYTQQMGKYMYCASGQHNFPQFVSNLSIAYTGKPLTNLTLYDVALGSSLNTTQLNACIANSTTALDYQSEFANLYHIVSTPTVIVNCKYSTLPQTLGYSINYSLSHLNN